MKLNSVDPERKAAGHFRMESGREQAKRDRGSCSRLAISPRFPLEKDLDRPRPAARAGAAKRNCGGKARTAVSAGPAPSEGRTGDRESVPGRSAASRRFRKSRSARRTVFAPARRVRKSAPRRVCSARGKHPARSSRIPKANVGGNAGSLRLDTLSSSSKTSGRLLRAG